MKNEIRTVVKVVEIKKTMVMVGLGGVAKPQYKIVIKVEHAGIPKDKMTFKHVFYDSNDIIPSAGDDIFILVDPLNPSNLIMAQSQSDIITS